MSIKQIKIYTYREVKKQDHLNAGKMQLKD